MQSITTCLLLHAILNLYSFVPHHWAPAVDPSALRVLGDSDAWSMKETD